VIEEGERVTQLAKKQLSAEDLAAIEEIKQLKAQYCYCVDHKDSDRFASLFTPDARVDLSASLVGRHPVTKERIPVPGFSFEFLEGMMAGIDWPLVGREAIQSLVETMPVDAISAHHVFVPEVELTSETTAKAIWPLEDYIWWPEGSPVRYLHGFGHSHETYKRLDDDRWYIDTIDFTRIHTNWR
jgi:hypothetical protein